MEFKQWDTLVYGIGRGECILFLGPQFPVITDDNKRIVPSEELARRLQKKLGENGDTEGKCGPNILANTAQHYLKSEGDLSLEMEMTHWNEYLKQFPSSLHLKLANLPFRLIVTSSHDTIMEAALKKRQREPFVDRYHYKGENKELLPEATIKNPLLFYLYGCLSEPSSVVVTETHLLDFLAALISKSPPLPNDLNASLTNGRLFLFLGFGLHQWYLRILLHVLKVLHQGSRSFAFEFGSEELNGGIEDAILFYGQNFNLEIYKSNITEFIDELCDRCPEVDANGENSKTVQGDVDQMTRPESLKVFICHASEDAKVASRIHDGLLKFGLNPWLDKKSLRGGQLWDDMIEKTIGEVDNVVVLNSVNLLNKSQGVHYVNKEIKTALRADDLRFNPFIIPVNLDNSPLLEQLSKFQVINFTDLDIGLRDLVRAIKRNQITT